MDATSLLMLVLACSPQVHPQTARALIQVESAFNPWAIGVVGGQLQRQPGTRAEAVATARALAAAGWNFSVGLGQINRHNFDRLGLSLDQAFDPCSNLQAMQTVLGECFERARLRTDSVTAPASATGAGANADSSRTQTALQRALSCYYSGNFRTGFQHGYVRKVLAAVGAPSRVVAQASLSPTNNRKEST